MIDNNISNNRFVCDKLGRLCTFNVQIYVIKHSSLIDH